VNSTAAETLETLSQISFIFEIKLLHLCNCLQSPTFIVN